MRFRQIHLDFHTSPFIPGIGKNFDKKEWQETLQKAAVDSITCFSSCHHGWSYHPTKIGKMHPNLDFNLLRAEINACHEINVNVPIYLTGGVNNVASAAHPEWREITKDGGYAGWSPNPLTPGFHKMCFNSPYLDYLCAMLREAVTLFPDANGVFIDIVHQGQCCCPRCMADMQKEGYDPEKEEDRIRFARRTMLKYYQRTTEAVRCNDPKMPIFHNSGNITKGDREILPYFSHLELESLPTGGWGYDHYPMSAAYCRKLDKEFLGMTGKFHTTWGEFGGFKHPNALRYECAAMLAQGSKCSIGDQLHPSGKLDPTTYEIVGQAYREVAQKEAWCDHVKSAAKIAVLCGEAVLHTRSSEYPGDIGAARILLELHQPFDFLDAEMPFDGYSMLILPDVVRLDDTLAARVRDFIGKGGKVVLSCISGMKPDADEFQLDIGAAESGVSPYAPDYILADAAFVPDYVTSPFVMYGASRRIRVKDGIKSLGRTYDPYFNRTYAHFSSHQHTPYKTEESGYDAGSMTSSVLYFAHPVFTIYRGYGNVLLKQFIGNALRTFAGDSWQVETDMPSQGRVTVMEQPEQNRTIVHLLYANTILRGGICKMSGGNLANSSPIELIEDLNPSPVVSLSLLEKRPVKSVTAVPEGIPVAFEQKDCRISLKVDSFVCHRMLEIRF